MVKPSALRGMEVGSCDGVLVDDGCGCCSEEEDEADLSRCWFEMDAGAALSRRARPI